MDLAVQVASLTADDLAPVVQNALNDDRAWPDSWEAEAVDWAAVNPSTSGLFRVSGAARGGTGLVVPWVVVLKVVGDVDLTGSPLDQHYMHERGDWNYWKREALAYESGLLEGWAGPLVAVRCLGVEDRAADQAWIWLEALGDVRVRQPWTLARLAESAYGLGAMAAQWAVAPPRSADHPWLTLDFLGGWVRSLRLIGVDHALEHAECWSSVSDGLLPASTRGRVADFLAGTGELLATLRSLPLTLAHNDASWSNLFSVRGSDSVDRTVAIDWSLLGLAAVGSDLGLHVSRNIVDWAVNPDDAAEHDRTATAAYLQGLSEFGWNGDVETVLFARAAAAALREVAWLTAQLSWLCPDAADVDTWPEDHAARHGISVETVMHRWATSFTFVLDLADEARARATGLT